MLLSEDVLDFSLRVDEFEDEFSVLWHGRGPDDGFALLFEVVEEIAEIFAFINAQQGVVGIELFIKVIGPHGCEKVAFFIGGEGVHEKLIHFHDDSEFSIVFFGREDSLLGFVFFEYVLDPGAEVIFGFEFLLEHFDFGLFLFPEGLLDEDGDLAKEELLSFADHFC